MTGVSSRAGSVWAACSSHETERAPCLSFSGANDRSIGAGHGGALLIIQFQQDLVFSLEGTQGKHDVCDSQSNQSIIRQVVTEHLLCAGSVLDAGDEGEPRKPNSRCGAYGPHQGGRQCMRYFTVRALCVLMPQRECRRGRGWTAGPGRARWGWACAVGTTAVGSFK